MSIFLLEENILLITIYFMKNFSFKYAFVALSFFAASFAFAQNPVKIVGSDIVGDKISKEILAQSNLMGAKCVVEMNGSRDGLNDLKAGKADIAIVAILDSDQFPDGLAAVPFAHQIASIIVNSQNPIEEITIPQLRQIFGSTGEQTDTWSNLGLNNTISLRNIYALSTGFLDNIAVELFKSKCLDGENMSDSVDIKENLEQVVNVIKSTTNAIAIVNVAPNNPGIKALAVAQGGAKPHPFKPTSENIQNGDYPLALHFYLVFDKKNVKRLRPVLQMLLSDNIANGIDKGDLVSAPKNFRKSYSLELDISK